MFKRDPGVGSGFVGAHHWYPPQETGNLTVLLPIGFGLVGLGFVWIAIPLVLVSILNLPIETWFVASNVRQFRKEQRTQLSVNTMERTS
ncbi:MAG: hypothetical protein ABSF82_08365 [Candidatus Bathyarchaeia archaeon]